MSQLQIEELIPHSGKMRLLDEVLSFDGQTIRVGLRVRDDGLFNDEAFDGRVPAWVGLEYMAQAVAAHSGVALLVSGEKKRNGFLLGTRSYESNVDSFAPGAALVVTAQQLVQSPEGLGMYACSIEGDGVHIVAKITGYLPNDETAFWATVAGANSGAS